MYDLKNTAYIIVNYTAHYCVLMYTSPLGVSLKVVQMLQHFEHLVTPLAQAVEMFANTFGAKNAVSEVIRYSSCTMTLSLQPHISGNRRPPSF